MSTGEWVKDVVRSAVRKELGEEPQGITMTSTRLTSKKVFPASASVKMADGRTVEVAMTIEADMYRDFKVIRGSRKEPA
ncbi:MAG: hypothetical protein FJ020_03255 [Chloroflexi bacterium]|nr:hypothetical protein [Chloroflexota bacterium]